MLFVVTVLRCSIIIENTKILEAKQTRFKLERVTFDADNHLVRTWEMMSAYGEQWIDDFDFPCEEPTKDIRKNLINMKQTVKRSSFTAGLSDEFLGEFERRLRISKEAKISPSCAERLEVADKIFADKQFVSTLLKHLPEVCVRKLATTCSKWRTLTYKTLRERCGNDAFSVLWIDNEPESCSRRNKVFDCNIFFHHAYIGDLVGNFPKKSLEPDEVEMLPETREDNCHFSVNTDCLISPCQDANEVIPVGNCEMASIRQVELILAYGTENMESEITWESNDSNENTSAAADNTTLLILGSSVLATTPDGSKIMDSFSYTEVETKLMTGIMFPSCSHLLCESFLVPSSVSESSPPCVSKVIGMADITKKPKALILYQYLNLIDCKPGIVEVLQSLQTTPGSNGFPMVTGIYNYLDVKFGRNNPNQKLQMAPVAIGLFISGDDFCNVSVITVNLSTDETFIKHLTEIQEFYSTNNFTTKCALMFYHNEVTKNDSAGASPFKSFIGCFSTYLPDVKLHGIGSLSGAHSMFVNPGSNQTFNNLNARMMEFGTVDCKASLASMELILVLLSYQADQ